MQYGEVCGFLGPNGAGEATMVRTFGALIAPTFGSATVAGIPEVCGIKPGRRFCERTNPNVGAID